MKNTIKPNPNKIYPVPNIKTVTYIKPTIKNPNIIVGDFTYFADINFEKHVTHHYDFNGDKLKDVDKRIAKLNKGIDSFK